MDNNDIADLAGIWRDRIYRRNLIMMIIFWISCTACFYLMGYYIKYIPGNIYFNVFFMAIGDLLSPIFACLVAQYTSSKVSLSISFIISTGGASLILGHTSTDHTVICILVMLTRFGISSAFTLVTLMIAEYFPVIVCSRIFGITNLFCRIVTIFVPMLAELPEPYPMAIFVSLSLLSTVSSFFLV